MQLCRAPARHEPHEQLRVLGRRDLTKRIRQSVPVDGPDRQLLSATLATAMGREVLEDLPLLSIYVCWRFLAYRPVH